MNKKYEVLDDIRKRMGVFKVFVFVFLVIVFNYNNCNNWFIFLKVKFIIVNWKIFCLNVNLFCYSIYLYVIIWGFIYVMYSSICIGWWCIYVLYIYVYSNIYRFKDCSLYVILLRCMNNLNIFKNWKKNGKNYWLN